ncbi:hypothetical protein JXB41_00820 [Candidatus Woesearchaeota archaeon]|nr:hypothetical protein [Candidatus Woesearchaeota archaeon]
MKIIPLAFDSLGTRSMCTFVETKDAKIIIGPSVALGPKRYNLPPHKKELQKLEKHWKTIVKYAKISDILIITHYHYDHHNPEECLEMYKNKTVLIKHPTEKINLSQKKRAKYFLNKIKGLAKKIEYADKNKFKFGKTKIEFSPAVEHGTNSKLGYVTEVLIDDGYKLIHSSDVEGPALDNQTDFILKNKPNLLILDGPLSYMLGYRYSYESLNSSIRNMIKIINKCPLDSIIIDHHFLRDLKWKEHLSEVFNAAEKKKIKLQTAAEYASKKINTLEAHRKELYKK